MAKAHRDSVEFFVGARGSGKTSLMQQHARGFGRVLAYSPVEFHDNYAGALSCSPTGSLAEFVQAASSGSAVYVPPRASKDLFDVWSKIVWHVGDCLALVDELADVTRSSWAPQWWGEVCRKGRHRRICIAAGAQRPADVDKAVIANSTRIACFRLARSTDRRYMADELCIDRIAIDKLQPLEYLDADRRTGRVIPGKIVFR